MLQWKFLQNNVDLYDFLKMVDFIHFFLNSYYDHTETYTDVCQPPKVIWIIPKCAIIYNSLSERSNYTYIDAFSAPGGERAIDAFGIIDSYQTSTPSLYPCWYTKNYICHIFHLIDVIYVQKACWWTDVWGRKQGQQPKGDPVTRRECCRAKGRSPRAPIRSTRRWGRYEYGWSTPILDLVWSILYDLGGRTCNTILHNSFTAHSSGNPFTPSYLWVLSSQYLRA